MVRCRPRRHSGNYWKKPDSNNKALSSTEGVTENTEYEWRYRLPAAVEIQIDQEEHSTYQWMPIDAAIDAVWSWTNREALEDLQKAAW
jgi:8-oxo-dGTP pyrophosphatase MutT (NUDIX family)